MTTEKWIAIPGWEGWYEVSNLGRVRSLDRVVDRPAGTARVTGRILVSRPNRYGYPQVHLKRNGSSTCRTVHSLVLAAFVGEREPGKVARHLNGVPSDARLENLAYGTNSENQRDKRGHGTDHNVNKTHCAHGHAYQGRNLRVTPKGVRECRTCVRDRTRRYQLRKAGAAS